MTLHEREVMQEALAACRKDYLHAIESINLEIRLGACRIRASELTVRHDEIVQRIKQIDRACLAQPEGFNPDWDQMAVLVEEQQRMAKQMEDMREWVGLTEKYIVDCFDLMPPKFARAIEAKLKEKNI